MSPNIHELSTNQVNLRYIYMVKTLKFMHFETKTGPFLPLKSFFLKIPIVQY